jgi:acyl transferase domain-containing protein/NADPH:quinone reductase-like Zn-dependent oxidoreductase/acyl carrier protein
MKNGQSPFLQREPIAIVGIGCRFPGSINGPQSFWDALCEGRDGISDVPQNRWDIESYYDSNKDKPGKIYTKRGGFLENIDRFDPQFFGISPREASNMDPQQRLLLETSWEALEDGGIPPENIAGEKVGVFVGLFMHDYENIHSGITEHSLFGPHSATGLSATISANRLSYVYDYKGPSVIVDTACSSSLVALHLASQSLLNNESDLALAGGVNLLLRPEMTMVLCKGTFLSPDGNCKAFDASANGYVRSDGVAVVVLKRLSDAVRDNDSIYALVGGSAINQDGKSEGLTVPSSSSQVTVIRDALARAGKSPEDIQYVEAHGTGTAVGDPKEAGAIGSVFSANRSPENPCVLGSVKTNIGHTESAAGLAGLIKVALMLKNGKIPPNLHFNTPNPKIPFEELKLRVPTTLENWPDTNGGGSRAAGVNSFGFGGTNAHAVLESYQAPDKTTGAAAPTKKSADDNGRMCLVPLSAHTPEALKALAKSYSEFLESDNTAKELTLADIGHTASLHRNHHAYRLTIATRSVIELPGFLTAFCAEERRIGISVGKTALKTPSKPAFVFSGMGQQWIGMGRKLYGSEPVFREVIDACDRLFKTHTDEWSVRDELTAGEQSSRLHETRIIQPCIFSVQAALSALWASWGVVPDAIVGHSVGEIAAMHVAGILNLEDAVRLCFHRSRLQHSLSGKGTMLAVGLTEEETQNMLGEFGDTVSIAAINSSTSLTLSGEKKSLEIIAQRLEKDSIFARFLNVDIPFHSPLMDGILDEFRDSLEDLKSQPARCTVISTVTGKPVDGNDIDVEYWLQNVRQPVRFHDAVVEMIHPDRDIVIEISAHPVLATSIRECISESDITCEVLQTLRRGEPDDVMMYAALGRLYTTGYPVDWSIQYDTGMDRVKLPTYKWQGDRYWTESEESHMSRHGQRSTSGTALLDKQTHPLLGGRLRSPAPVWNTVIDPRNPAYLQDHIVQGSTVFPAAGYCELALAAAGELFGESACALKDIEIKAPLILDGDKPVTVQVVFGETNDFSIYSKNDNAEHSWILHASGSVDGDTRGNILDTVNIDDIKETFSAEIPGDEVYRAFRSRDLNYGPSFQSVTHARVKGTEALGQLNAESSVAAELDEYRLHPAILDACFQVLATIKSRGTYLPVGIDGIKIHRRPGAASWCYSRLDKQNRNRITGDILLFDDSGELCAEIRQLRCNLMAVSSESTDSIGGILYEYEWKLDDKTIPAAKRAANDFLLSPADIGHNLRETVTGYEKQYERKKYFDDVKPEMDSLCTLYILEALKQAGISFDPQETFTSESLAEKVGVTDEHRRLFDRLIAILKEDGIIEKTDGAWNVTAQSERLPARGQWNELLRRHPLYSAELLLLERCGSQLCGVLRGEEDPLALIFPQGSLVTEHLYQHSPTFRIYNRIMQRTVAEILEHLPAGQTLKILEIGAGTGAMASSIIPMLPKNRASYVFTDISASFTTQAEQKFRSVDCIDFQVLNIEKDPVAQGFDPNSFDLIIASDVLHATADLKRTIDNVKRLLTPSGLLLLLEVNDSPRWFDLVFGMLKGWWLFEDKALRPAHAILPLKSWISLLESSGFTDAVGVPEKEGAYDSVHSVIAARGPEEVGIPAENNVPAASENTTAPAEAGDIVILLADKPQDADRFAGALEAKEKPYMVVSCGESFGVSDTTHITVDADQPDDFSILFDTVCSNGAGAVNVINLLGICDPGEVITAEMLERVTNRICSRTLHFIQALMAREWGTPPRFLMVTNGTQSAGINPAPSLSHTPLWGLGRVMTSEFDNLETLMVDLSSEPSDLEIVAVLMELSSTDGEDEIALRGKHRYISRLIRKETSGFHETPEVPFRLTTSRSKGFEGFAFSEMQPEQPGPGEVAIKIRAAGVNFKDVAKVAGLLSDSILDRSGLPEHLGMECAGDIVAIGEGVDSFAVGDEVMGIALNCFGNYTICRPATLVHKPSHLSFEEAATIPLVFLAAEYALHQCARIRKGDRVLIHTAAGGVGLSAIQVAREAGADVFATAGSREKREFLKSLGVTCVSDSRSFSFVEDILEQTGGEGVDIIINTLPASTISKSMSLLKPITGRFIDISNVYDPSLTLYAPEKGVAFHTFTLETMIQLYPDHTGTLLKKIMSHFDDRTYNAIPFRTYPISEISSAFRYMRKGVHIGKLVISMDEPGVVPQPSLESIETTEDGTYLIIGGLGGFGMAVAQWLAGCGARHLVLSGRSGASTDEARNGVNALRESGVEVLVERCDIAVEDQVGRMLDKIDRSMPPLRGVIHAAMVLDDAPLMEMDAARMKKVMDPKILGAWNLHALTADIDLDFFICFSSFSSLIGNSDQGNYVAGNYFLDSLARFRQAQGLPSLTVNWGAIADVGYVARHDEILEHFRRQGTTDVSLNKAWQVIAWGLREKIAEMGVSVTDWNKLSNYSASIAGSPRFSALVKKNTAQDDTPDNERIDFSVSASPEVRKEKITAIFTREIAKVLGISQLKLDIDQPLDALGFDSLMAVEIVTAAETTMNIMLPKMTLLKPGLTISGLSDVVEKELLDNGDKNAAAVLQKASPKTKKQIPAPKPADTGGSKPAKPLVNIDGLSDTEVESMLSSMLSDKGNDDE